MTRASTPPRGRAPAPSSRQAAPASLYGWSAARRLALALALALLLWLAAAWALDWPRAWHWPW